MYKTVTITVEISSDRGIFFCGDLISEPMYVAELHPLYANIISINESPIDFQPPNEKLKAAG